MKTMKKRLRVPAHVWMSLAIVGTSGPKRQRTFHSRLWQLAIIDVDVPLSAEDAHPADVRTQTEINAIKLYMQEGGRERETPAGVGLGWGSCCLFFSRQEQSLNQGCLRLLACMKEGEVLQMQRFFQ
jgi:hypothetical protein